MATECFRCAYVHLCVFVCVSMHVWDVKALIQTERPLTVSQVISVTPNCPAQVR